MEDEQLDDYVEEECNLKRVGNTYKVVDGVPYTREWHGDNPSAPCFQDQTFASVLGRGLYGHILFFHLWKLYE